MGLVSAGYELQTNLDELVGAGAGLVDRIVRGSRILREQAELFPQRLFAGRREVHDARASCSSRPSALEAAIEQSRTQGASEMMPARAPIETCPAQGTPPPRKTPRVEPDFLAELPARLGELDVPADCP